jgi:hypothetical protein
MLIAAFLESEQPVLTKKMGFPVLQNPSRREFEALGPYVRGWLVGKNAYFWDARLATHGMVAQDAAALLRGIPVRIEGEQPGEVLVTGTLASTAWAGKLPEAIKAVREHPAWKRTGFIPNRVIPEEQ